jgi:hypothetical protein
MPWNSTWFTPDRYSQSAARFTSESGVSKCSPSQVKASAEDSFRPLRCAAEEASLSRAIIASSIFRNTSVSGMSAAA